MVRILSEQFCGSKYDSCHYFVFLFHLILIKRLQGFNSSPLLLRNQPEKEIIYVQTHTLIPAL